MFRVCPGVPEGITLCIADVVAVLTVNQFFFWGGKEKTYADHAAKAYINAGCQTIA